MLKNFFGRSLRSIEVDWHEKRASVGGVFDLSYFTSLTNIFWCEEGHSTKWYRGVHLNKKEGPRHNGGK